ncbi:MAG: glycosyltransferase family 4 protein [Proteobacteria bacterium]|nr:glycosyltransferase family 4 protein [Pseudomonadota bacterium]MBU1060625.1 glycosyltransferase family 4 protein [Pseudomonadota bacterium]
MKIVIDVGVIGLAQLFETARTGIYRVISSLSLELLARDDLDLSFSSLSSLQVNQLTDHYFAEKNFAARSFPRNWFEKTLITMAGCNHETGQEKKAAKILSKLYRISLTHRIGGAADLFHSHYSALPHFRFRRTPLRMLTIYDIIPLIHPEYFADGFADEFRPIVESFSPQDDFLFTISECTKNDICSYFQMDPERVFVTPLAAAADLYYPESDKVLIRAVKQQFHIPDGRYFLTLATVEKRKNLQMSMNCFREILKEPGCEDLSFVLVGTRGWKVKELLEEIDNDPILHNKVIFTGFVPDQYLSAIYSGAEAFLYPSLYEGFGLPPLEAMQCGLPVIVSNTSSLPEVVGDAGILVDPQDKDQICQAMLTLLKERDVHAELAQKGLVRAGGFSWQRCAEQTAAGYQRAWDGR